MGNIGRVKDRGPPRSFTRHISHIDRSRGQYLIYHDSFAITPEFEPSGAILTFLV